MKGYVLKKIGDITYDEIEKPELAENEVLVKVAAAGICGSDIPRIYETGAHRMPLVIGHEFSGKVIKCGSKVEGDWLQKRVGVFPLIPCRKCECCRNKQYEMCEDYDYLGSRTNGGFAEYVAVKEWNLLELPDTVSDEAAAMLEPMAVAVHAIRKADISKDSQIVVSGLGTIGLLIVMFLLSEGFKNLYVIGNKDLQKKCAVELGIDKEYFFDLRKGEPDAWIYAKTSGHGADCYFECVGRTESVGLSLNVTAANGQVILVGNPISDMNLPRNDYWKILRKQLTVRGTWNSSFWKEEADDWHYVLKKLEKGEITPEKLISHRFSLKELKKGFEIMKCKSEDYVKIMGIM